jgi:hypothetical protein
MDQVKAQCTTCFKNQCSAFISQHIYGFVMILRINSDYLLKQHYQPDICSGEVLFFFQGRCELLNII